MPAILPGHARGAAYSGALAGAVRRPRAPDREQRAVQGRGGRCPTADWCWKCGFPLPPGAHRFHNGNNCTAAQAVDGSALQAGPGFRFRYYYTVDEPAAPAAGQPA